MTKYFNSKGQEVLSLTELLNYAKQEKPVLLPWETTFEGNEKRDSNSHQLLEICDSDDSEAPITRINNDTSPHSNTLVATSSRLLGTREIACLLGVSQRKIQRMVKAGVLPKVTEVVNKRPKWDESVIISWVELKE